jgi:hypothetical protein
MLIGRNGFDFRSIESSISFIFGYGIWWLKIDLILDISSCQVTLVSNYKVFEFQNGEYNKICSFIQFSISLYLL